MNSNRNVNRHWIQRLVSSLIYRLWPSTVPMSEIWDSQSGENPPTASEVRQLRQRARSGQQKGYETVPCRQMTEVRPENILSMFGEAYSNDVLANEITQARRTQSTDKQKDDPGVA